MRFLAKCLGFYIALCACLTGASYVLSPSCARVTTPPDVVVVLSAGWAGPGILDTGTRARLETGLDLAMNFNAVLAVTGGNVGGSTGSIAAAMADHANAQTRLLSGLVVEPHALSTLQNAQFTVPLLPEDAQVLVVTERFHALRSAASFALAGRPSPVCASPTGARSLRGGVFVPVYETAAWGLNIARGAAFGVARVFGMSARLPDWFLA